MTSYGQLGLDAAADDETFRETYESAVDRTDLGFDAYPTDDVRRARRLNHRAFLAADRGSGLASVSRARPAGDRGLV